MNSMVEIIRSCVGLAATFELLGAGVSKHTLALAVQNESVIRVRQGWYCTPEIHPMLQQAIRVGGRLGCVSAASLHGMWSPPNAQLHVSLDHNDCRLRSPMEKRRRLSLATPEVTTHWNTQPRSGSRLMLGPISSLAEAIRCQSIEFAVVIAGSALISLAQWRVLTDTAPGRNRGLQLADGICESGIESIIWVKPTELRVPLNRQVWIGGATLNYALAGTSYSVSATTKCSTVGTRSKTQSFRQFLAVTICNFAGGALFAVHNDQMKASANRHSANERNATPERKDCLHLDGAQGIWMECRGSRSVPQAISVATVPRAPRWQGQADRRKHRQVPFA